MELISFKWERQIKNKFFKSKICQIVIMLKKNKVEKRRNKMWERVVISLKSVTRRRWLMCKGLKKGREPTL